MTLRPKGFAVESKLCLQTRRFLSRAFGKTCARLESLMLVINHFENTSLCCINWVNDFFFITSTPTAAPKYGSLDHGRLVMRRVARGRSHNTSLSACRSFLPRTTLP